MRLICFAVDARGLRPGEYRRWEYWLASVSHRSMLEVSHSTPTTPTHRPRHLRHTLLIVLGTFFDELHELSRLHDHS